MQTIHHSEPYADFPSPRSRCRTCPSAAHSRTHSGNPVELTERCPKVAEAKSKHVREPSRSIIANIFQSSNRSNRNSDNPRMKTSREESDYHMRPNFSLRCKCNPTGTRLKQKGNGVQAGKFGQEYNNKGD